MLSRVVRSYVARPAAVSSSIFQHPQRRAFIFFPGSSTPSGLERQYQETKLVHCSAEEMFAVVANVNAYSEFLPFCLASRVTTANEHATICDAELTIGFKIFTETYTSRISLDKPHSILIKSIRSPTFSRIDSQWTFTPGGPKPDEMCVVHFQIDFQVSSVVHAQAIRLFFNDVVQAQMSAFIQRGLALRRSRARRSSMGTTPRGFDRKNTKTFSLPESQPSSSDSSSFSRERGRSQGTTTESSFRESIYAKVPLEEIRQYHVLYQRYATQGKMDEHAFVQVCLNHFHLQEFPQAFLPVLFSSFCSKPSSWRRVLSESDFVFGMCLLRRGTMEDKARNLFYSLDENEDGAIDREELCQALERRLELLVKILPSLLGSETSDSGTPSLSIQSSFDQIFQELRDQDIPLLVNEIFRQCDFTQTNSMSVEEWDTAWRVSPELVELLTLEGMMNIAHWAMAIQQQQRQDD